MRKQLQGLGLFMGALLLSSCSPKGPIIGKCGEYVPVQGWAVVTQLKPVSGLSCAGQAHEVLFRFMPAPGAKDPVPDAYTTPVSLSGVEAFPFQWLKKEGWMPGSKHQVTKMIQQGGACTPIVYRFPELGSDEKMALQEMCRGSVGNE